MNAITTNLRRLLDFNGREARRRFWPYAGVVFALLMVVGMVSFSIEISRTFGAMQEFAAENPQSATVTSGPGHYSIQIEGDHPELAPDFGRLFVSIYVMAAGLILLLAAAVSRRLHDGSLRAYWGLLPLPFVIYSLIAMPFAFSSVQQGEADFDMTLFMSVFLSNMLYMVALVTLIVLLCRPSTPGPNRYGEQPA